MKSPGVVNVNENESPVSSGFDLMLLRGLATVCGMSSLLVQTTVSPAFTFTSFGLKVKLSMPTLISAAPAGLSARDAISAAPAARAVRYFMGLSLDCAAQLLSGMSTMASRCSFCLKVMLAVPSKKQSKTTTTNNRPGDGAVPGTGCGKAVE